MMWLQIIVGVGCALWALQQLRMTMVYLGVLHSPVIGIAGLQPALVHVAFRDVLKYSGFAVVLFVVRWPVVVTYLLAVPLGISVLEFLLAIFGIGRFGSIQLAPRGRAYTAALELVPCTFWLVGVALSRYFIGW